MARWLNGERRPNHFAAPAVYEGMSAPLDAECRHELEPAPVFVGGSHRRGPPRRAVDDVDVEQARKRIELHVDEHRAGGARDDGVGGKFRHDNFRVFDHVIDLPHPQPLPHERPRDRGGGTCGAENEVIGMDGLSLVTPGV